MPDNRIGAAFVEVATRGLAKVQSDLLTVKDRLNKTAQPVSIPLAVRGTDKAQAELDRIKPHALKIPAAAEGLAQVQAALDKIKGPNVPVAVFAKGLAQVQAGIDKIKAAGASAAGKLGGSFGGIGPLAQKVFAGIAGAVGSFAAKGLSSLSGFAGFVRGGLAQAAGVANSAFEKLNGTVAGIGSIAARGFFGATAAITGFVKMASPKEFEDFQFALAAVAIQLGRIFLPLLREATAWLMRLRDFFRGLSDEQREAILHWVRIGLAIAGVLILLPRVMTAFRALQAAMAIFGAESALATGGLTLLLGAIAAAVPLLIALFGSMNGEGFGGVFAQLGQGLQQLWGLVQQVFSRIGAFATQVIEQLMPIFQTAIQVWTGLLGQVFEAVGGFINQIAPVINNIVQAVLRGFQGILPVVQQLFATVGTIFGQFIPIVGQVFQVIGGIVERIVPIFFRVYTAVETVFVRVLQAFSRILGPALQLVSTSLDAVSSAIFPVLETIADVVGQVIDAVLPIFTSLIDAVVPVVQQVIAVFQRILVAMRPAQQAFAQMVRVLIGSFVPVIQQVASIWQSIMQDLMPVFDMMTEQLDMMAEAFMPLFQIIGDLFQTVAELLMPVFQLFANFMVAAYQALAPVIRMFIQVIVETMRATMAVLRPIFEALGDALRSLASNIRNIINVMIDMANALIRMLNRLNALNPLWTNINELAHLGELQFGPRAGGAGAEAGQQPGQNQQRRRTNPNDFRGEVRQRAPELIGLAEVWKKFQTSQAEDLATRIAREQLNESRATNNHLDTIATNTRPNNGWQTPGMEMNG